MRRLIQPKSFTDHLTWNSVCSLFSMFLNCSSSSSVSALMMGSILPVLRLGTLNTSFSKCLESIRPDQENKWINLGNRQKLKQTI